MTSDQSKTSDRKPPRGLRPIAGTAYWLHWRKHKGMVATLPDWKVGLAPHPRDRGRGRPHGK